MQQSGRSIHLYVHQCLPRHAEIWQLKLEGHASTPGNLSSSYRYTHNKRLTCTALMLFLFSAPAGQLSWLFLQTGIASRKSTSEAAILLHTACQQLQRPPNQHTPALCKPPTGCADLLPDACPHKQSWATIPRQLRPAMQPAHSPLEEAAHAAGSSHHQRSGDGSQHHLHHRQVLHVLMCLK